MKKFLHLLASVIDEYGKAMDEYGNRLILVKSTSYLKQK